MPRTPGWSFSNARVKDHVPVRIALQAGGTSNRMGTVNRQENTARQSGAVFQRQQPVSATVHNRIGICYSSASTAPVLEERLKRLAAVCAAYNERHTRLCPPAPLRFARVATCRVAAAVPPVARRLSLGGREVTAIFNRMHGRQIGASPSDRLIVRTRAA